MPQQGAPVVTTARRVDHDRQLRPGHDRWHQRMRKSLWGTPDIHYR